MNNLQETAERIKIITKQHNLQITKMLLDLQLGKNTVSKMSKGTDVVTQTIVKIADFLDCSVDYLLGRTGDSKSHKGNIATVENTSSEDNIFFQKYTTLDEYGKRAVNALLEAEYARCLEMSNNNSGK